MAENWTALGTKEYSLTVEPAVSLSGSIDFLFNGKPVSGQATGSAGSTLTADYTVNAEVHGDATKYVKFSLVVDGKEVGNKVITVSKTGEYSGSLSYEFKDAGEHSVKAIIYEGDNMSDWTQLAEKDISVKITAPVKEPTIEVSLSPTTVKPNDTVTATIKVTNPNDVQITGTVYLGYVENQQFQTKYQANVTVPANGSKVITTTFTPAEWGMSAGTYSVGAQGKFNINGNNIVVSSNGVTLTVEKETAILPPKVTLSVSPNPATAGKTIDVVAKIYNPNTQSGKVTVSLKITYPDGSTKTAVPQGWSNISVGANSYVNLSTQMVFDEPGNYTITASAVLTVGQAQKSAESNPVTLSINSPNAPKPPVMKLATDRQSVTVGEQVTATVTIINDTGYDIEGGKVEIILNGEPAVVKQVGTIKAGGQGGVSAKVTIDKAGQNSLIAKGTFTINGQSINASSNAVTISAVPPAGDDFAVYLSYPNKVTAGEGFTLTVSVRNTGKNLIDSAKVKVTATQYDGNGNPVATIGPLTANLSNIAPGEASSQNVIVVTKDVPGELTGQVSVTADFSDGKTMNKSATFGVQVTAPSGGTSGGAEGELNISTPLLIGAGLVGLLLVMRHEGGGKR